MTLREIYITGSGIVSAIGVGKEDVLQSLLQGQSGVGPIHHLVTEHTDLPVGEVRQTDGELREMLGIPAETAVNRTALLGAVAVREALAEARLGEDDLENLPLLSGTTVGGMDYTERYFLDMQDSDQHLATLASHDCGTTTEMTAHIAGLDPRRTITVSTACSSAANAIIMGANLIRSGRADRVVAGGAEALSKFHLNGFNTLMILDHEPCRPFDRDRRGLNLGEGAAYVVLESAEAAARRGAKPLAVLSGYGNACDAHHQTASSDDGEGAYLAMQQALAMAGIRCEEINYINAHGTGTPNNDQSESVAIRRVFGEVLPPVSSTKSMTGHTTSASGSIETVICLLAMQHGFLPANVGWQNPMEQGIVPTMGCTGVALRHVMCNSFGFGGNDSCLILSSPRGSRRGPSLPHTGGAGEGPGVGPKVYVRSISTLGVEESTDRVKEFVSPMEARRMCRLLKAALTTSLTALRDAGVQSPDAIITATTFGMLENSEKFLLQMCRDGEHCLGPTLFMQSTHNTLAGLLGIKTHCHGYNITITQSEHSIRTALLDALLQFQLTPVDTILVGSHDESTEIFASLMYRLTGIRIPVGQSSVSVVLSTNPTDTLGELDVEVLAAQLDPINVLYDLTILNFDDFEF